MDSSECQKVQCVNCGFLAKFDRHFGGPPPYIYEMPPRDRETGQMSALRLEAAREINCFPQCYVNAANLYQEIDMGIRGGTIRETAAREAFSIERLCKRWHRYTEGFSPQEHLEEERVRELELEGKAFELRMQKDNKTFMNELHLSNRNLQIFLALIVLVFTIAQTAFPNGWPWLMKLLGTLPDPPALPPMPGF